MRYSLRNKPKIEAALGADFLKWLNESIKVHFKNNDVITPDPNYINEKYPIIHVTNIHPNSDSTFELYVVSITFDVYLLAYKSVLG